MSASIIAKPPARSPSGSNVSKNERIGLRPSSETLVELDGESIVFPIGSRKLEFQQRLCGDYYAEIQGTNFYVSGVGATQLIAAKSALAKIGKRKVAAATRGKS